MANQAIPSFDPTTDIPFLAGKTILITGTNSGLGRRSALELAKHGPVKLWMTARDPVKGHEAVEEVKQAAPDTNVSFLELDLSSFAKIKKAAATVLELTKKLDILMLNAGCTSVLFCSFTSRSIAKKKEML